MSVSARYQMKITAVETLETGVPAVSSPNLTHEGFNVFGTLNASSAPPATKIAAFNATLVAGALTLDLTALTGSNGAAVTFSGLKLQLLLVVNGAISNGVITGGNGALNIAPGASNGYVPWGASNDMTIAAGGAGMWYFPDTLADVSGSTKTLDLTGGTTDTIRIIMVAG